MEKIIFWKLLLSQNAKQMENARPTANTTSRL